MIVYVDVKFYYASNIVFRTYIAMVDFQDPNTTKCRIFVKNTPKKANFNELKEALTAHFSKYGNVLGKFINFNCNIFILNIKK